MSVSIGGALISSMTLTYSWGGSPASAEIIAKGSSTIGAGDDVVLNLDGLTFHGRVVSDPVDVSDSDGAKIRFSIVDNRERLKEDIVLCRFNKMVILADDPETPGIDEWKRYEHILPGTDWESQTRTFTDEPLTAEEILDYVLDAPTVVNTWTRSYHAAQSEKVHEIDANHGKKLLNVVQEVTEAQGLVFTLTGENLLTWARKGEGVAPSPNNTNCYNRSLGESLNTNDTRITVVGDANRYQELSITLEPDWASPWEDLWVEPAWLAAVDNEFGPFDANDAGRAQRAAKARSVTVREYVGAADDPTLADYGKFGGVSRMDIPAWIYLQQIVWHAYRVPRDYTINGVPLENMTLVEEMLIAVEHDLDNGEITVKEPDELYPPGAGYVIAQGQQLGILDPRTQRTLTPEQLASASVKWTANNRFKYDKDQKAILFEDAVFKPGTGANALFVFPNRTVAGVIDGHPLYNICVPNADAVVTPAVVRASLTFDVELFSAEFGTGRRAGADYVSGLNLHSLLDEGANVRQILYKDGSTAADLAEEYAESKISNQVTYAHGGFNRKGVAGTALNGSIDRVTASLTTNGIDERIEFTKERGPSNFTPEGELARRNKEKDRYPGERALQQDVRDLHTLAALMQGMPARPAPTYGAPAEVMQTPVGCQHAAPRLIDLPAARGAGEVIWTSEAVGTVDDEGPCFAGVVIAEGSAGTGVALATQGIVPVLVRGPFSAGDALGQDEDETEVTVNGERSVGIANESYAGTDMVLVPVRIGSAGGASDIPFKLKGITEIVDEIPGFSIRVVASTLAGDVPLGMFPEDDPVFVITEGITGTGVVFGKVTYTPTTGVITAREILAAATLPADDEEEGIGHVLFGGFSVVDDRLKVNNLAYGPIPAQICRKWFEDPVRHSITFFPSTYISVG